MQDVTFYFDARCPWCYQTSKWAKRLEELGQIRLDWGVCALQVLNADENVDPMSLAEQGGPYLRTTIAISRRHGSAMIGSFYGEVGALTFEQFAPPPTDRDQTETVVRKALVACGLEPSLLDEALEDESTWREVVDSTLTLRERVGDVGVPTIALDGGSGPAIFGPVIVTQPNDDDAVELWRHVEWLARNDNFAELKRKRSGPPDLPSVDYRRGQEAG
jgi:hypothetical protein